MALPQNPDRPNKNIYAEGEDPLAREGGPRGPLVPPLNEQAARDLANGDATSFPTPTRGPLVPGPQKKKKG